MTPFLSRLFGCWFGHQQRILEKRDGLWYFVCSSCAHAQLVNPRDKAAPHPVGTFNAAKLSHAKQQADKTQIQRQKLAAKRSTVTFPPDVQKAKAQAEIRTFPKKAVR